MGTKRLMRTALASMFCVAAATPALAQDAFDDHQKEVLNCLAQMENGATWESCLNVLFSPCAEQDVGGEEHVICLTEQREVWTGTKNGLQADLVNMLTAEGGTQMMNILHQWHGYVGDKCSQVSQQYEESGAESAKLGCEISELTGLTAELALCHEKASTAPFCTHRAP